MLYHSWASSLALAAINLSTKFEMYTFNHYEDMEGDPKCRKWGSL